VFDPAFTVHPTPQSLSGPNPPAAMAANMPAMAGGQMMPRRPPGFNAQQLTQIVVNSLMQQNPITGWQAGVQTNERMGKIVNL